MKHVRIGLAALATAGLLTACGGGSGPAGEPQAQNEVPATAVISTQAYTEFAGALAQSDTAKPLGMSNVSTPPTSETAAPIDF